VGYGNDMDTVLVMAKHNLKRKLLYTARAMSPVDADKPLRIGLDIRKRNVHSNTEIASGRGASFGVPIRRCL
jgi:hypothetical protein